MIKHSFKYYQIKKGETLKSISQKFNIDSTQLLIDNQISPKQFKEGVFVVINKD